MPTAPSRRGRRTGLPRIAVAVAVVAVMGCPDAGATGARDVAHRQRAIGSAAVIRPVPTPAVVSSPTSGPTTGSTTGSTTDPAVLRPADLVLNRTGAWTTDVRTRPVASGSAAQVKRLTTTLSGLYNGVAALNNYQYGTSWYTVAATTPTVRVAFNDCQNKRYTPAGLYGTGGVFESVPIPVGAIPSRGSDANLAIYRPATDQVWTFWRAALDKTTGTWSACWGGRLDQASRGDGVYPQWFGTAAAGLSREALAIGIREIRQGEIKHAVALELPWSMVANYHVAPATRHDGTATGADAIPEGARLRLDPTLDISTLRLSQIARIVAVAAQRYGFVVTDQSGTVSIPAEEPWAYQAAMGGKDPWPALQEGRATYEVFRNFPWDRLQVLQP